MKEKFLLISNHYELASFFGFKYSELAKIIYDSSPNSRYHEFYIKKSNGDKRQICAPCENLKSIQVKLKDVLYEIYPQKPSAHGFLKNKSIVTNAECHLNKKFIFNIDLSDFFGTIHFGRVKNLFKSPLFEFNDKVATILAHISCFNNSLPQGAPSSPIISNMIAWKMDSQLQRLAKATSCTYTRYVDDISFSFTCEKRNLPNKIIALNDSGDKPGHELTHIIESNGFSINCRKVRLCSKYGRMEVTGLTVNESPNVRREFVRQISSMLHSWRKFGYEAAQQEFVNKYQLRHTGWHNPLLFQMVLKGKLAFLRNVRTGKNTIFRNLATQYNMLVEDSLKMKISDPVIPLRLVKTSSDDKKG
jgi:RNA-directed DNA polymerase